MERGRIDSEPRGGRDREVGRTPGNEAEFAYWLRNMLVDHRFTPEEAASATALRVDEVQEVARRLGFEPEAGPHQKADEPLRVRPYPGGRHPRIGFLDGAVHPQRETKVSVFTPWDPISYVVADVPEAIWSNLGLLYLAHTHVPTLWTQQSIELEAREWSRCRDGSLQGRRRLPNGIEFGTLVRPTVTAVRMAMWLKNGTGARLTDLRVQNCVMLGRAAGFTEPSNENKVFSPPYAACRSAGGDRWVITAWEPCDRLWGNPPCPCMHSDPKFPDCGPGETRRLRGWLSFYEGRDIRGEFRRIDGTGWRRTPREQEP